MKTIIKSLTLTALLAIIISCNDFLTLRPSDSITAETSITSVPDAKVAISGVYANMTSLYHYGRQFLFYADYKGSDLTIFSLGRGDSDFFAFQHEQNNNEHESMWITIYSTILQTNNIVDRITLLLENEANILPEDVAEYKNIKGQALALRAMCHFDLVRLYGYPYAKDNGASLGVPIVKTVLPSSALPGRSTVAQVYEAVIQDLIDATSNLLSQKVNNGFINYYGACALLSRVYLYKGDYTNALLKAEEVINCGLYTPYQPSEWVASWKKQFASESIFELKIDPADNNDLAKSSPRWYTLAKGQGEGASGCWIASPPFMNRLGEDQTDVRWGIMQYDEYHYYNHIPGRKGSIMKYDGDGKSTTTATNIKILRLSEVYLIAAEAALLKPGPDKTLAKNYLNMIRKRAPALAPATEETISLDMILSERSKELVLEGHRYFDQLRVGKTVSFDDTTLAEVYNDFVLYPPESRGTSVDWNYYRCVLPISLNELNANSAIKNQQNPGY